MQRVVVPAAEADTWRMLGCALGGGPAVAPLPADAVAADRVLAMVRPDVPLERDDIAAVVATSGSTGQPKGVLLSRTAIAAAVSATHARLGGVGVWHCALPVHYVAGLMVLARSWHAGTEPIMVGATLDGLHAVPGERNYLSLVPTQLARALRESGSSAALTGFDAVLLGGAAAHESLLDAARAAGVNVVTTYGMSETCGGCVYDGHPLDGTEITLESDGRVLLTTSAAFSGYRCNAALTDEVLRGSTVRTNDRGEWRDGRLRIIGRLDDVVISGGVNVDLAALERAAGALVGDGHVCALGMPDPEWGTSVVLVTDAEANLDDLRARLAQELEPAAIPKLLRRVRELPRTQSGKIDRPAIQEALRNGC